MQRLLRFLIEQPILLVIALAWIVGMINNVRTALKKARERGTLPPPPASERTFERQQAPAQSLPTRTAEQITQEMRRILGGEPTDGDGGRGAPSSAPAAGPRTAAERHRDWDRPSHERPPVPVVPSTPQRRLPTHIEPHMGEAIGRRANLQSRRPATAGRGELGDLGGRVHHEATARAIGGRYALTDLKRIIVLNEILGPPLALRRDRET